MRTEEGSACTLILVASIESAISKLSYYYHDYARSWQPHPLPLRACTQNEKKYRSTNNPNVGGRAREVAFSPMVIMVIYYSWWFH